MIIAAALGILGWGLWVRRHTWTCRHEVAQTSNLLLQAAGAILISPACHLGRPLYYLTGQRNLDDLLGHMCLIAAGVCLVYMTLSRLGDDEELAHRFEQHIERPLTIIIPVMLALFLCSQGAKINPPAYFTEIPIAPMLLAYWIVFAGTLSYLFGYSIRCLLVLRRENNSQAVNLYLFACAAGILSVVATVGAAAGPGAMGGPVIAPVVACGSVMTEFGFGAASIKSWRERLRLVSPVFGRSIQPQG